MLHLIQKSLSWIGLVLFFQFNAFSQTSAFDIEHSKSMDKYSLCYKSYLAYNNKFISNKDLALKSNENIAFKLNEIIQDFDSCLILLKPILDKKKLVLLPIETFRLDGLLTPDNKADTVFLWDYSKWAKSVLKSINSDVIPLKKRIINLDNQVNESIKIALSSNSPTSFNILKDFVNQINSYDYNSLPLNILMYKKSKLELINQSKNNFNTFAKGNIAEADRKQQYFYEMYTAAIELDSQLVKLKSFNLTKEYPKYEEYISTNYRDNEGLSDYFLIESNFVRSKTNDFLLKFRTSVFNSIQEFTGGNSVAKNQEGIEIPLYLGTKGAFTTQMLQRDFKGQLYVAGINNNIPFTAKINSDYTIVWMNLLTSYKSNDMAISALSALDDGCVLNIFKSGNSNTFIRLNNEGKEISARTVLEPTAARYLIFDELSEQITVAYKGSTPLLDNKSKESSKIITYSKDGTLLWEKKIILTGSIINFSKISEGYLWVANFSNLALNEKNYSSSAGDTPEKTNILLLKIGKDGSTKATQKISYIKPIFSIGTAKISNNNIHIVGYVADFIDSNQTKKFNISDDILHFRINANLKLLYNNLIDF